MKRAIYTAAMAVALAGCGSGAGKDNPFAKASGTATTITPATPTTTTPSQTTPTPGTTDGVTSNGLPPGTTNPTPNAGIVRREAQAANATAAEYGNGFANAYTYNSTDDTFSVEGLAFDGDQPSGTRYARSTVKPTLSTVTGQAVYSVYESPVTVPDPLTGTPITQLTHRAIYGVSSSGETEFAIVRTGSYIGYGFGGFIYERKNNVVLPTSGQATYGGDYAGLRDFQNRSGLEYVTGRMDLDVDLGGFSGNCTGATCADAIKFSVTNRQIFDMNGTNVTASYLTAANANRPAGTAAITALETITARIGPNTMTADGEATGNAFTSRFGDTHLNGSYFLVMSGNHTAGAGGEVVGIIVVEGDDPRADNVIERETGGFILHRQ